MPLRTPLAVLATVAWLAAPLHAAEGIVIVQQITSGGSTSTNETHLTRDRMRTAISMPQGGRQTVIFDGVAEELIVVDDARKSYSVLTKAEAEKLGAQLEAAMAQMQAQMAQLPPEMRKQMESMMAGRGMMMPAAAAIEYRETGTATVGRWTCTRYEGTQGGARVSEVCTVEPGALGFTEADFAVIERMAEFLKALVPQGLDQLFAVGGQPGAPGYSGVPVRQATSAGGTETVTELTDARRDTFPDELFAVPEGYRRQAFASGLH
jgi:hypothetical protein